MRSWGAMAALVGLVAAVYWPVAGYEFVNWDDPWYVLKNPLITSWHPANLWKIATEMSVKNYAPLTTLSLLMDHSLFGMNAGGYHVVNVVLHAANVLLVCLLVTRLTGHRMIGLLTAALFAVHPVQIETVAWVSSRKTLLCSLFMLASGLCWLRTDRTGKHELWGTAFLALALLAKAAAIVVPPIVIAFDLLLARKKLSESIGRQLIPTFLCVLLLGITMSAQSSYMGGVRGHMGLSKGHILAIDSMILALRRDADCTDEPQPVVRSTDDRHSDARHLVGVRVGAVGWLCWHWRKTRPGVAFAVVCWFCLLSPVLNFFPITTLMNDRYLYLPCVGFFAIGVTGAMQLMAWSGCFAETSAQGGDRRELVMLNGLASVMVAAVVCGYALISIDRLPIWKNDQALWRQTVGQVPQLAVVQIQWADSLHESGHPEAAVASLQLALNRTQADPADRRRMRERLQKWKKPSTRLPTSFVSLEAEEEPAPRPDASESK